MIKELRSPGDSEAGNPAMSPNRKARATPMAAGDDGKVSVTRTQKLSLPGGGWTRCGDAGTATDSSGRRKRGRKIR